MYIKTITKNLALTLCTALALPAAAAPRLIGNADLKVTRTSYSFFYADPKKVKLTAATIQTQLQDRLIAAGLSTTPCLISADQNANNVVCGGAIRFGADFFPSTALPTSLSRLFPSPLQTRIVDWIRSAWSLALMA